MSAEALQIVTNLILICANLLVLGIMYQRQKEYRSPKETGSLPLTSIKSKPRVVSHTDSEDYAIERRDSNDPLWGG